MFAVRGLGVLCLLIVFCCLCVDVLCVVVCVFVVTVLQCLFVCWAFACLQVLHVLLFVFRDLLFAFCCIMVFAVLCFADCVLLFVCVAVLCLLFCAFCCRSAPMFAPFVFVVGSFECLFAWQGSNVCVSCWELRVFVCMLLFAQRPKPSHIEILLLSAPGHRLLQQWEVTQRALPVLQRGHDHLHCECQLLAFRV